jgi:hypothetical protein
MNQRLESGSEVRIALLAAWEEHRPFVELNAAQVSRTLAILSQRMAGIYRDVPEYTRAVEAEARGMLGALQVERIKAHCQIDRLVMNRAGEDLIKARRALERHQTVWLRVRSALHEVLAIPCEKRANILLADSIRLKGISRRNLGEAMGFFASITSGEALSIPEIVFGYQSLPHGARGFSKGATIAIAPEDTPSMILHQMGHVLEWADDWWNRWATKMLEDLRRAPEPSPLQHLTDIPGYGTDEMAFPGRFICPYQGKIYEDGQTEITATCYEILYQRPEIFARDYPVHFTRFIDRLRGAKI